MSVNKKVCVTGAGGFVGGAICRKLFELGYEVHAIVRKHCPELEQHSSKIHTADISIDTATLAEVFNNAETVFHVASKVDMWGHYNQFYQANVIGTRNVISACKLAGVSKLIFTSSPSVVADGCDLRNINESYPVPKKHHANYPATKAMAEAEILCSNCDNLKTIALRPHLIFGPGDKHFIPTIIERAKQGRMLIVGNGQNIVDVCFIEDCVSAHICAMNALDKNSSAAGKTFFISQGDPIKLWNFIDQVLNAHGLPVLKRRVPKSVALALAGIFEFFASFLPIKPLFTRFLVGEMTTDHYFDLSAAKVFLNFKPRYSVAEAIQKAFFSQQKL